MQAAQFPAISPSMFVLVATLYGLVVGSFLNVVIARLPVMMKREWEEQARDVLGLPAGPKLDKLTLSAPRSCCPTCGHKIRMRENIPLLSYAMLRGRCSGCKTPISWRYPVIELFTAIVTATIAWHFGPSFHACATIVLGWALISMSVIDIEHQLLPDPIVLPTLWCGLMVNAFGLFVPLQDALWGAVAGYGSLWLFSAVYKLVRGQDGLGNGDMKLLALFGAWGGWQVVPLTFFLACVVGAFVSLALISNGRRDAGQRLSFGPYLAIAGIVMLAAGEPINGMVIHFMFPAY